MKDTDFVSYADDNTPCTKGGDTLDDVTKTLESDSRLFQWLRDNQMKTNKCPFSLGV